MRAPLVYVWIGIKLPHWAVDSLQISQELCGLETILLTNSTVNKLSCVDKHIYIEDFYEDPISTDRDYILANKFRDGFWIKALERFLVLRQYLLCSGIKKAFHAELDNIIFDLSGLQFRLDSLGHGFFCPRDSLDRGIASLVYINDLSSLECFNGVDLNFAGTFFNDMTFLGSNLKQSDKFYSLPTENSLEISDLNEWDFIDPNLLGGIFDAASIGQYLFGIDTRNRFFPSFNGFVNENSGNNLKNLKFEIDFDTSLCMVSLPDSGIAYKLFNIHVHSKIFARIKQREVMQRIINRMNLGKKTLIKKTIGYGR